MASSEQKPLQGPDLSIGIEASTIADGAMLLGHAGGDAVLLSRFGDEFTAIGATCTHYGGPLAEGITVGDAVRCPWHHACFSRRTGEALAAPALNPVPTWRVEREGTRVRVTEKVERDPLAPTFPIGTRAGAGAATATVPTRIAIVGAGAAGSAAAEMLRRCGFTGSVTVIDEESDSPYDRPNLSKDYLAGNAPEEWIPLRPPGFYKEHEIDLVRARATRLDLASRRVELEGRDPIPYDALLLATGADPVRLDLPGVTLPHVRYLRSLADSRSIIEAAKQAKRAVVIGSSFIGLEVAASLRARQVAVDVVAPERVPLERVLGEALGEFIGRLHEDKGVTFHLQHKPARIDADAVILDDGTRLPADLVVIGVGVRPRLQLGEAAGLRIDRGIVVNEFLETSAPHVYAAGDIAKFPDPRLGESIRVEHWVVAQRMGQCAARNMLGAGERYDDVPFFWSAHYDVSINYVGHGAEGDVARVDGDPDKRDVAVRFEQNGKVHALATIYRDQESLEFEVEQEGVVRD